MTIPKIARLAFLTTPAPGVFLLNFQLQDGEELSRVEISKAHLSNILIDGCALALRDSSKDLDSLTLASQMNGNAAAKFRGQA